MFEKVNPSHPDKVADRIAGAIVDKAYEKQTDPKIAVEVLIGHGNCTIITETSVHIEDEEFLAIVDRIAGPGLAVYYSENKQDEHLSKNQSRGFKCGDNGIFKGVPVTMEQRELCSIAKNIYGTWHTDGKYILDGDRLIICQSCATSADLKLMYKCAEVNPLGDWTGGANVDSGATNRKLGSDMGDSVTGGGLHGKDLSKADVSVNIYCWIKAQITGKPVTMCCAIGDAEVDGIPYGEIVEIARDFIKERGGFEKFAEWGLIE